MGRLGSPAESAYRLHKTAARLSRGFVCLRSKLNRHVQRDPQTMAQVSSARPSSYRPPGSVLPPRPRLVLQRVHPGVLLPPQGERPGPGGV